MITLAVAAAFQTLASQLSDFTGGEDGLSFKNPSVLQPVVRALREPAPRRDARRQGVQLLPAVRGGGAAVPAAAAHRQLALRPRAAGDPRERLPRRGHRLPHRRLSHAVATCCRRCSPPWPARCWRSGCATPGRTRRCRFEIMLDILLIVVIGGMGTMYGAVIGAVLFVLAQNYLQDLLKLGARRARRRAGAVAAGLARPLAALAGRAVRAVGLPLPDRRGRAAARSAALKRRMTPTSHYIRCLGRELHYTEWGAQHDETVIAWHGLARTGRDMDDIAAHLAQRYRVICPDTIGRGLSQWSPQPAQRVLPGLLCAAGRGAGRPARPGAGALARHLDGRRHRAEGRGRQRCAGRIRRLVLNDVGPQLADAAIAAHPQLCRQPAGLRHGERAGAVLPHASTSPMAAMSDAQWRRLTETSTRRLPDGRVTPHYDPAMVMQFTHHDDDYALWDAWDSLDLPVLCLRGEHSDLLLPEVADAMRNRGPRARGGRDRRLRPCADAEHARAVRVGRALPGRLIAAACAAGDRITA